MFKKTACLLFFIGLLLFFAKNIKAAVGINGQINFQGKLVNTDGTNVTDGSRTIVFTLYDAASAGTQLWQESDSVTTTDGIFRVALGGVTSLSTVDFNSDSIYLGIKVGADSEMTPRVRFAATPYAFNSQKVGGLTITGTASTSFVFPSTSGGTVITTTQGSQTIQPAQATGTVLGISDITTPTGNLTGLAITLNGVGAFTQTGLNINLTNASATSQTGLNIVVPNSTGNGLIINNGSINTVTLSQAGILTLNGNDATADIKTSGTNTLKIDTGGAAALTIGGTNQNALTLGRSGATTSINGSTIQLNESTLSSGTGLNYVGPNTTTISTAKLINIANSTTNPHTFLSLDNRDETLGGHVNQIGSLSGTIVKVFVYDTTSDIDGGRWTNDEHAQHASWYNEASSGTRSAIKAFPKKAILIATTTNLYVYDAKDNTLWMQFNKGATTAESMIGPTTNSVGTSTFGMNGRVYYGNSGTAGNLYVIDFKSDIAFKYSTAAYAQGNINISSRNSTTPTYLTVSTVPVIADASVSDVYGTIANGKTYIAVGLNAASGDNGAVSLINETNLTVANFGIAANNTQAGQVFLMPTGSLYATIGNAASGSTNYVIKVKHNAIASSGNNNSFTEIYGNANATTGTTTTDAIFGSLAFTAGPSPIDNTFVPNSLYITQGTSFIDGKSNTIYAGSVDNLLVIQANEQAASPQSGSATYYNSNLITEEMIGDIRTMLPMAGSGTLAANTLLAGADSDASVKAVGFTTKGTAQPTHTASGVPNGIRGTGLTFNGTTDFICTATAGGTCANVANTDFTTGNFSIGFWLKVANAYATASTVLDKRTNAAGAGYFGQLNATANKFTFTVSDATPNTAVVTSNRAVNDGTWHHYIVTWSRSNAATCAATTNPCNLALYIDGSLDTSTANTNAATLTNTAALNLMANSATTTAAFVAGSMDEFFVTGTLLNAANAQYLYQSGYRALQNHPAAGRTFRGTTITQDNFQKLNGTSNQVAAVSADMERGMIYAGTTASGTGGVTVIGMLSDSLSDVITTTTSDDNGTAYSSNTTQNASISLSKGFGTGALIAIGNATTGLWAESQNTTIKDFMSSDYNPFGLTLDQSNLNVDQTFRVVNQLTSRLSNLGLNVTAQPQYTETFKVDANGVSFGTTPTLVSGANTGFSATPLNSANTATLSVGNTATTDNNNRTVLNVQNGGTGYLDMELVRGMINFQQTNYFDEEFTEKALDTTNRMTSTATGTTGLTCGIAAGVVNGIYRMTTGTIANNRCDLSTLATLSNGFYQRGNNPVFEANVKPSSATNGGQRMAFGFTAAVLGAADTLTTNHAYILKRSADTVWQCSVADGTTERVLSTGVAIDTAAFHRLRVTVQNGTTPQVVCSIDNTSVVMNTNTPLTATAMDIYAKGETVDTTTENIDVDYVRAWQDDPPLTAESSGTKIENITGLENLDNNSASESANLISSLALNPNGEDKLTIKDKNGNEVASFDNNGNANFIGTITAKTVKAESIVLAVNGVSNPNASLSATLNETRSTIFNNLSFLNKKTSVVGALEVSDILYSQGGIIVTGLAEFKGRILYNDQDTAGFLVIKKGGDEESVNFDKKYPETPIVNVSLILDNADTEQTILSSGIYYALKNLSEKGFSLKLNKKTSEDLKFAWNAISVKNAKTTTPTLSPTSTPETTTPTPTQSSTILPIPSDLPNNASLSGQP